MRHHRLRPAVIVLMCLAAVLGCGGDETPAPIVVVVTPPPQGGTAPVGAGATVTATPIPPTPPPEPAGLEIRDVVFAHGLSEQMEPVDPGSDFSPAETVYLSVRIKGRPKEGKLTARFFWREQLIADAGVDLADVNSGLIFSIGEDTFAGYTLTHDEAFPISEAYRAELSSAGQTLGSHVFRVVPPPEAIPSAVREVVLAQGVDEEYNPVGPATQFAPGDTVHLVGRGDLGLMTWVQADWYRAGVLDEEGTRSLTLEENAVDTGFAFSYLPEGGWPEGEHFVVLTMNDQEVGRYAFEVDATLAFDEGAFWDIFPLPDDAEEVPVVEGFDLGFSTAMIEPELFEAYAVWLEGEGWQQQAPAEAVVGLPHQRWRKDGIELLIEIQGLDEVGRTVVFVQLRPMAGP